MSILQLLNTLLKIILCVSLFAVTIHATAQSKFDLADSPVATTEEEDDDLVIIDEEGAGQSLEKSKKFSIKNYFNEHFSSELFASYSGFIGSATRQFYYLQSRYIEESKKLGLSGVLALRAYNSSNELKLKVETYSKKVEERTIKASNKALELREAYLRLSRPLFDLYAGKRVLAFGQFDSFSPVDFLLPIDFGNSILSFSKVTGKFPQTVLSATLYPIDNWELNFHYFPKIERDYTIVKLFEKDTKTFRSGDLKKITKKFKKPSNESQKAVRLIYTGEKVILGFTYYKGFHLIPESLLQVKGKYFETSEVTYRDNTAYGFEMAYPYKNFNIKYELLVSKHSSNLASCFYGTSDVTTNPDKLACDTYVNYLTTEKGGKAYIEPTRQLHAIGFDYNSDNWIVNFALIALFETISSKDQKANDLMKKAARGSKNRLEKTVIVPTFHVAKKYGIDKKHTTGFGFGFMSSAVGASLYHNYKYSEDLFFMGAIEYLSYRNDLASVEQVEQEQTDSRVTLKGSATSLRVGVAYQF